MKMFSWLVLFVLAFFVALVMVLTFIQPEFKQLVGAQILTYKTRQLPVYFYVIGAFGLGVALGVMQALYTFVRTRTELFRKNRRIRELEQLLDEQSAKIAAMSPITGDVPVETADAGGVGPSEEGVR